MNSILKQTLKENGYTYKSMSEKLLLDYDYKISKESIAKYADGSRTPEPKLLVFFSKILNVSIDYLLETDSKITRYIPLIGLASCGTPQEYDLNGYDAVPVDNATYRDGMYAVQAEGDSMSPTIQDGNLVYCSPNDQIENGNLVHYKYNGESGLKRYKINEAQTIISLIPINQEYDIITIDEYQAATLSMARVKSIVNNV